MALAVIAMMGSFARQSDMGKNPFDYAANFGRAALRISTKFRMKPQDRAGQPTAGRLIRLPIAWNLPPTAPN